MRTTLNIDDDLMRRAREFARVTDRTLTSVIEDALRTALSGADRDPEAFRFEPVTVRGRLRPGADIDDRDALHDRMDDIR